jgi:hypothetical protein
LADSSIVPTTVVAATVKVNEVSALAELKGEVVLAPPPHPATKATSSNATNHLSDFVTLSNLFILHLL